MTGGEAPGPYGHHDGGEFSPVKVRTVATWPASTFVENLAIDSTGAVFVSLHSHNRIDRYDPATGRIAPFADLPAPPMGLAFGTDGLLWVTGGPFPKGPGYIWRIAPDGTVEHWVDLPDAIFMNGCTFHPDGRTLLACESVTRRILAIDTRPPPAVGRLGSLMNVSNLRSRISLARTASSFGTARLGSAYLAAG